MGLMDKLRDMFTEEVEEEKEIKSEVIQVEIPAPQKKEEHVVEEEVKKEEKVSTPIFFDDNDFVNLETPRRQPQATRSQVDRRPKKVEVKKDKKEDRKIFKPTPIISPVYGVLDKNYHKEDIKPKNISSSNEYYNHKDVNIDDIRKKAYGTLEDDLEVTLFGETKDDVETEEIDMFDELMDDDSNVSSSNEDSGSDLFNLIDSMYEKEGDDNGGS